jgi:hypothetical protein
LFHCALKCMYLKLFLVGVLIPYAPLVEVLSFLLLVLQQCSSERGMLNMLALAMFLLWCTLPFFFPQQGIWSSHPLMEAQGFSCSCKGECWSLCSVGNRPLSTSRVVDCHSVEELGFQLLDRRDVTVLQGVAA